MHRIRVAHSRIAWLQQTENWLYNQVKYLDEGIEAHVICSRVKNLDQFRVGNIHKLESPSFLERCYEGFLRRLGIHTFYRPFYREIRKIEPAILHSHFGPSAWSEMPAARKAGLKHLVTFYGYDVNFVPRANPVWRQRYEKLFGHIDLVLCEGPFMAQSIVSLGCPGDKVKVHHLGIPVNEIAFKPRAWKRGQVFRVLIAASFREKKGIPYALEALARMRDMVSLEITLIGDANRDPEAQVEKARILDTIDRYNLNGSIRMLGYQPHPVLLKEAYDHHVFVSPSVTAEDGDSEGGAPVVLLEMAATGMPVVSTKHCDIPEVIHDGETGCLAEERDVEGLVSKLKWLMEQRDNWADLLQKGRRHVEKEYNVITQGIRLSDIYRQLLV